MDHWLQFCVMTFYRIISSLLWCWGFVVVFFALKAIRKHEIGKTPQNRCARPTSSIVKQTANMRRALVANQVGVVWAKRKVEVEKIDVHVDWRYVDACG